MRTSGIVHRQRTWAAAFAAFCLAAPAASAQEVAPGRVRLTSAQADAAATRRLGRVEGCYKSALGRSPTLFGVLAVGFKVAANGTLLDRWIAVSTVGDPELEVCTLKAFEGLVFPAPGANGAEVRFGILLSTDVKKKTDRNTELPDRAKLEEDAWRRTLSSPASSSSAPAVPATPSSRATPSTSTGR